jgi:hypothetical protein
MAPTWSQRGKEKKALEKALNMRLHPGKRKRCRGPRHIHTLPEQGHKSLGEVGQNVQGYNSWEEAIRVAQTSSERVVKRVRDLPANPEFETRLTSQE